MSLSSTLAVIADDVDVNVALVSAAENNVVQTNNVVLLCPEKKEEAQPESHPSAVRLFKSTFNS